MNANESLVFETVPDKIVSLVPFLTDARLFNLASKIGLYFVMKNFVASDKLT